MRILFALLLLTAPAWADVSIQELLVARMAGSPDINFRVSVVNDGASEVGPVTISLYARKDPNQEWTLTKRWTDIPRLAPGNRVARDHFAATDPVLGPLTDSTFEVRAEVEAPGVSKAERVTSYKPEPAPSTP